MTTSNTSDSPAYLSVPQVAELVGLSRRTVLRRVQRGDIRAENTGRRERPVYRIARAEVAALVQPAHTGTVDAAIEAAVTRLIAAAPALSESQITELVEAFGTVLAHRLRG